MHLYLAQCQSFKKKKQKKKTYLSAINHGESLTKLDESLTCAFVHHRYAIFAQREDTLRVYACTPVYVLQIYKIELSR